jgi:DNA-binding transcriptional ArsR family regulator
MTETAANGGGRDTELPPEALQRAAATFGLLASTTRLHILWLLAQGEHDVGTLADRTGGTLQTVSQHLAKLKLAGLVHSRREGRRQVYLVADARLVALVHQVVGEPHERRAVPGRARGVGS